MEVGCVGGGNGKVLVDKKSVSPTDPLVARWQCCLFFPRGAAAMMLLVPAAMLYGLPARRGGDDAPDARAAATANGVPARSPMTCCSAPCLSRSDSDRIHTPSTCRGDEL